MPAMEKLKLSIAAKISRAWPATTVLLYLTYGSEAGAWERVQTSILIILLTKNVHQAVCKTPADLVPATVIARVPVSPWPD